MRSISRQNLGSLASSTSTSTKGKAKASTVTLNAGFTPNKRKRSSVHLPSAPNGAALPITAEAEQDIKAPEAKKKRMSYLGSLADAGGSLLSLEGSEKGKRPKRRSSLLPGKLAHKWGLDELTSRRLQVQVWLAESKEKEYPADSRSSSDHAPKNLGLCPSRPPYSQTCLRPQRLSDKGYYHLQKGPYGLHVAHDRSEAETSIFICSNCLVCFDCSIKVPYSRLWTSFRYSRQFTQYTRSTQTYWLHGF